MASGHLLSTAAVQANPAQAVYCIEVTTDRGTDFQLEKSERETALPLPETANKMREWVLELSRDGVEAVVLGLTDNKNIGRVSTKQGALLPVAVEVHEDFSTERIVEIA